MLNEYLLFLSKNNFHLFPQGASTSLGLVGNYLGGANIFIKRELFHSLKGFTEYKEVGFFFLEIV